MTVTVWMTVSGSAGAQAANTIANATSNPTNNNFFIFHPPID
jgi:hypothetical protein